MFNKSLFLKTLLIIILINLLSFFAYYSPWLAWVSFLLIIAITAFIAWHNLFYGVLIILVELMISSQGYLFSIDINNFRFSLRMGLFIIILTVGAKYIIFNFQLYCYKTLKPKFLAVVKDYKFYILLCVFIIWGVINGLLKHNNLKFLYQDVNGFLFFLLLPIFVVSFKNQLKYKQYILSVWIAAIVWQFIVVILLLFFYSHLDIFWRNLVPLYKWFRDQRIIEVGLYKYNFFRIFMQSQLWVLMGFFVFGSLWIFKKDTVSAKNVYTKHTPISPLKRGLYAFNFQYLILIFLITILIISLSRSFWIAGFLGFCLLFIYYCIVQSPKLKKMFMQIVNLSIAGFISLFIISLALIIPIGKMSGLKSLTALTERTTTIEDPAISSRWDLLPALWQKIKPNIFSGHGFGSTVTYKTSDPRYLSAHSNNPYYTAFAFEWGWLDIWYKIGLLGLLTYLILIISVLKKGMGLMNKFPALYSGLFFSLIALAIVHFFTPFLNHPLGIGYLLLADVIFRQKK